MEKKMAVLMRGRKHLAPVVLARIDEDHRSSLRVLDQETGDVFTFERGTIDGQAERAQQVIKAHTDRRIPQPEPRTLFPRGNLRGVLTRVRADRVRLWAFLAWTPEELAQPGEVL